MESLPLRGNQNEEASSEFEKRGEGGAEVAEEDDDDAGGGEEESGFQGQRVKEGYVDRGGGNKRGQRGIVPFS